MDRNYIIFGLIFIFLGLIFLGIFFTFTLLRDIFIVVEDHIIQPSSNRYFILYQFLPFFFFLGIYFAIAGIFLTIKERVSKKILINIYRIGIFLMVMGGILFVISFILTPYIIGTFMPYEEYEERGLDILYLELEVISLIIFPIGIIIYIIGVRSTEINERRKAKVMKNEERIREERKKKRSIEKRSIYLKTFPYFCENCKKFAYMLREYCENCGAKDRIRLATKEDYLRYIKEE